jgi:probable F420-dependent oxidoreductase
MRFAVHLPVDRTELGAEFVSAEGLSQCSQQAEACGFEAVYVTDHPAPDDAWLQSGGHHSLDPFTALSFAAAATSQLKLMTNILVLPYRNALLQAKSVASLDRLSGGRVILGVGAGYLQSEFDACGANMENRGKVIEENLQVMKSAWTGEVINIQGRGFSAQNIRQQPTPLQNPHPPIWMGGNSPAAMRRAAQYCDGWLPIPVPAKMAGRVRTQALTDIHDLANAIGVLRELEQQFERSKPLSICMVPFGLSMFTKKRPEAQILIDQFGKMQELGVNYCNISLPCQSRQEYLDQLEAFEQDIIVQLKES